MRFGQSIKLESMAAFWNTRAPADCGLKSHSLCREKWMHGVVGRFLSGSGGGDIGQPKLPFCTSVVAQCRMFRTSLIAWVPLNLLSALLDADLTARARAVAEK